MGIPNATLGGVALLGARPVQWTYLEGVRPHTEAFDVDASGQKSLQSQGGKPLTLSFTVNGVQRQIKNLWLLNISPGDNPQIVRAVVADRRWMLPYFGFLGRFNMRRNVGYQRVGDNSQPVLQPVVPDIWYWRWSLKTPNADPPESKWQPSDVLTRVFDKLIDQENEYSKSAPGYRINDEIKKTDKKLPIENFVIDESGEAALQLALSRFPEAGLYVDDDGQYVVYSKISGKEKTAVQQLGAQVVGAGHIMQVNNDLQRPKDVEVRFTMEVEVRHDYVQSGSSTITTLDTRSLRNVLALPDFTATVNGASIVQGNWVEVIAALIAWGTPPGVGGSRISDAVLEKAALPYLDLWASLLLTGLRSPDADWAGRVAALQQHWRRTFQINTRWMDRSLQIKAARVGLVDAATGTMAPSPVYCDHSFIGTQRSFFKSLAGNATLEPFINIAGYPVGEAVPGVSAVPGSKSITPTTRSAPAMLSIVDGDLGILHVDFRADQNHMFEAALPGKIVRSDEAEFGPTHDLTNPNGPQAIGFDMVCDAIQVPKLSTNWKLATIVTHIPASPNDERQLYSVIIKPSDVDGILPQNVSAGKGPRWVVRVRPGHDSARALIRWLDARAPDIEKIFGVDDPNAAQNGNPPNQPNLDGLVLNAKAQTDIDSQQAASLNEIARAIAASLYARFSDRLEGQASGHLNSKIQLDGWMESMSMEITPKGEGFTRLKLAEVPMQLDMRSLLDSGTRAILDRIPQPHK